MFSTPNSNTIDLESMQFNESGDDVSNLDVVMSTLELNEGVVNCDDIDFSATERPATPQPQTLSFLHTPSIHTCPVTTPFLSFSSPSSISISATPSISISATPSISFSATPSISFSATPSISFSAPPSISLSATPSISLSSTSKVATSSSPSVSLSSAIATLSTAASSTSSVLKSLSLSLSLQNQLSVNPSSALYPRLTSSRAAALRERYPLRRNAGGGGGGGGGSGGSGGARNTNSNLSISSSSSRSAYGGSDSDSDISYNNKDKKLHGVQNNAITRRRSILINPTEREIRKFYLNESLNIRPFTTDLETVYEEVIETRDDIVINGHHGTSRGFGGSGGSGIGGGVNAIVNNRILNNFGGIVSDSSDSSNSSSNNRTNASTPMTQIVDPNRFLIRRRKYKRSLSCSDFTVAKSTVVVRKRKVKKEFSPNQILWHQVQRGDKDKDNNSV